MSAIPSEPRPSIRRIVAVIRNEGLRSALFKVLNDTIYRRAFVMVRTLDGELPPAESRLPVELSIMRPEEIKEYAVFNPIEPPQVLRDRLTRGQLAFLARYRGRIAAVIWAAPGPQCVPYLRSELPHRDGDVYMYEGMTAPELRGNNLASVAGGFAMEECRRRGYRRAVFVVLPENRATLRLREKNGFRVCGKLVHVRLGPWSRTFVRMYPDWYL